MRRRHFRYTSSRRSSLSTFASPETFAQLLGEEIRLWRQRDGRPLEELAPLAGITVEEWQAIEAGQAPDTGETIDRIYHAVDANLRIETLIYAHSLYNRTRPEFDL